MPVLRRPERVTPGRHNDQLLYFTSSSLTADDRRLVVISDETGHPNLFVHDLQTGDRQQLTDNREGYLKSYVYFAGTPYRGFGRASVSLDPKRGVIYHLQGREVRSVDLQGRSRVLAELPPDQMTAFTHVSDDGARLCVPTIDARALDGDRQLSGHPGYDIDRRVQDENLASHLRVFDTATGNVVRCERVPRAWITHVQFAPHDPTQILYNHEWPSFDAGTRRLWLWDGSQHRRLRPEGQGRRGDDWACHEMWERDGSAIIYHGKFHDGRGFVGRVRPDGADLTEIAFLPGWDRYGHFTVGDPGVLVCDGHFVAGDDDTAKTCPWISRVDVNWRRAEATWTPLCRHESSWASQDAHPHPIFDHAGRQVYFTSDVSGRRAVYRADAHLDGDAGHAH